MKMSTVAFLTEATCGEACWHAKEDVCRCSCGGKNHGILKTENGEQPTRQSKISGNRYELLSVGSYKEIYAQAGELYKAIDKSVHWHKSFLGEYEIKPVTPQQASNWKELTAYKDLEVRDWYFASPTLLWKRL